MRLWHNAHQKITGENSKFIMKKILVGAVLAVANLFYKKKKYKVPAVGARANLGCGMHCLPSWQNVDGSLTALFGSRNFSFINHILYKLAGSSEFYTFGQYDEIIKKNGLLFCDLKNGVPFADNSLDIVFTSHFLEHLSETDGLNFLEDCHRVLKPGGLLRILVPDLDFAAELYASGKVDEMLRTFFYTSDRFDFHAHKYGYNFNSLSERIKKFNFKEIKKQDFKKGECPNIDFLDVYPGHSLFVECKK